MNKKGMELSINTIVVVILALFVLVVLFFILQKGIIKGSENYFNFSAEAEREIRSGDVCEKMFSGRMCYLSPCPDSYVQIAGKWADCEKKSPSAICCEKK